MDRSEIERLASTLEGSIPFSDAQTPLACAAALLGGLCVNVGRIADALEAIARNTAPVLVENKTEAPGRDFIGIPAER